MDIPGRKHNLNQSSSDSDVTDQPESATKKSKTGNPVHDDIIRKPYEEFEDVEYVSDNDATDEPESATKKSMTGNPAHDDIIRKSGLGWYSYEEFKNVKYVTSGG